LSQRHNRRTICRYLFRTAQAIGLCDDNPTGGIDLPPRRRTPSRPLNDDEVERCRSHALFHPADLIHPVAWALAEATARTSEIARVLVGDVGDCAGTVRLGGFPRSEARTVGFTDWGLVQVRRRLGVPGTVSEDHLVPFRSRKVPRASASMAVIEVLRAAGISGPEVRPISVVAWRGAVEYGRGMPITEVAALLGIRSLDRTAALIGMVVTGRTP
jgi:integrase/recombinase XerC